LLSGYQKFILGFAFRKAFIKNYCHAKFLIADEAFHAADVDNLQLIQSKIKVDDLDFILLLSCDNVTKDLSSVIRTVDSFKIKEERIKEEKTKEENKKSSSRKTKK